MTASRTPIDDLKDTILAERKKGNIVFQALPGQFAVAPLDEFIQQPADGMLYDLNRSEEISLTFLKDPKWVNDFAVALVIRKLHAELAAALARAESAEKLARFGALVLDEHRENIGDIDGGWMQDKAEEMGLLERVEVQKACGDENTPCSCAEYGDFPQECLRYTKEIFAQIAALKGTK